LFFYNFRIEFKFFLRVLIKYITKSQTFSICEFFGNKRISIKKNLIPDTDFNDNTFGRPGIVVQIDEIMLNYRAKSHRGRSLANRTDALCIVDCLNGIKRA
ncbi:hypothetical protein H312_01168, partial [Anncaliia algerae PRA339]